MTAENFERDKMKLKHFLKRLLDIQSTLNIRCFFVGGCVRDRFMGHPSYDFDLAVEGDLKQLIERLQVDFSVNASILGTAKVKFGGYQVDLASFRSERYTTNNGLPEIDSGDIEADLNRRDFTINTGYVLLSYENLDRMLHVDVSSDLELTYAHPNYLKDIHNGVLRVLHERSFLEDPSRMLRAVKYSTLYPLKMDDATLSLFNKALKKKVLETYSKDRYRQIVLSYAKHEKGIQILSNLFEQSLLLRLDTLEPTNMARVQAYFDIFVDQRERGILYLLLLYEYQLDFWLGAERTISDVAKACRDLQEIVAATSVMQWQSRWWGYETFKRFGQSTLDFARFAGSIPEPVKLAIRIYNDDTQYIKLGIDGNVLKTLGVESGKRIGALMNLLLAHKVNTGLDMTQEEEIKWIESKRYEY